MSFGIHPQHLRSVEFQSYCQCIILFWARQVTSINLCGKQDHTFVFSTQESRAMLNSVPKYFTVIFTQNYFKAFLFWGAKQFLCAVLFLVCTVSLTCVHFFRLVWKMAKSDCYNFAEQYLYILIIFVIFYSSFIIYNNLHLFLLYFTFFV